MQNLTEVAELFIKSIEFEIKRDLNKGDVEGANLKELTKLQVEQVLAKSNSLPPDVQTFLGKVQGVILGVLMSGSDHPNPDGALMDLVDGAQNLLFPPKKEKTDAE